MEFRVHFDGRTSADAWVQLYVQHRRALAAYAFVLTGNQADAHDLIQDVLLRLLRRDVEPNFRRAYLLQCLRTAAADRHRARRGRSNEGLVVHPAFLDSSVGETETRELVALAQAALAGLPPGQREVIVLRIYGELTIQDVAEVLGRPAGSVASAYARGVAALREALRLETEDGRRAN